LRTVHSNGASAGAVPVRKAIARASMNWVTSRNGANGRRPIGCQPTSSNSSVETGSPKTSPLAGVALTLLVVGGTVHRTGGAVTEAVLDSHIRSLMEGHLTDVLTSDQHTVKPWLSAHLDVSPNVSDFVAEGFPLVGGREDYIDGHPAAVVVYRHAKHVINLFAWAATDAADAPFRRETRQGFNMIRWRHGGIEYVAVSDVEMDQLAAFTRLVAGGG